jgi:hypothetical protein
MREITESAGAMQIASEDDLNEAVVSAEKTAILYVRRPVLPWPAFATPVRKAGSDGGQGGCGINCHSLKFTDSAAAKLQQNIISAVDCKTETVARILKVA